MNKFNLTELELINIKTEAYAKASSMTNNKEILNHFYNLFLDRLIIKKSIEKIAYQHDKLSND